MTGERKRIWGWMAFDWATQPFYTLGLTFIFGPYFASVASDYFAADGLSAGAADARAQSVWAMAQTLAGLFIAFAGPLLGAYADSTGRRMPWIVLFSGLYIVGTAALWLMVPDGSALWLCLWAFALAFIAAEFALIFVNAQLPSLGGQEAIGKISGTGASLGYWGGVASLAIMLAFFFEANDTTGLTLTGRPPALGLDPAAREGTRIVGPFIAAWFALFMIPYFLWMREPRPVVRQGGVRQALADLKRSVWGIAHRDSLKGFLLSSMFYRDALNALYGFGGVYAVLVLDWTLVQIAVFGIVGAVTAGVATYVGGLFDSKFGPRPVIIVCILILTVVCTIIVGMTREFVFGITLAAGSSVPDTLFYICGAAIGGAGGAIYAASRSMMVRHTHPERPTEAFGLFALSGKATSFLAPAMIGIFTTLTESPRLGIAPVILLFAMGLVLLVFVNKDGDRAEWSDS
ncbi:MFS transporter [Roseisalinus antarcticus]|uniref:Vacuole effluxer Atg22 like protein n=1 Tax=Roseisalinus antarcticus TaxID=254357 RepID=A0A1Y5TXQ0_9RHOB|nr:MFS transporter [Roseisalinus antarcticus]SLN75925.1 Vacuole effluxer Atg22 like protein [Roseisalinus antarcticus]